MLIHSTPIILLIVVGCVFDSSTYVSSLYFSFDATSSAPSTSHFKRKYNRPEPRTPVANEKLSYQGSRGDLSEVSNEDKIENLNDESNLQLNSSNTNRIRYPPKVQDIVKGRPELKSRNKIDYRNRFNQRPRIIVNQSFGEKIDNYEATRNERNPEDRGGNEAHESKSSLYSNDPLEYKVTTSNQKGLKGNRKPFNPNIPSIYKLPESDVTNETNTSDVAHSLKRRKGNRQPFRHSIPPEYLRSYAEEDQTISPYLKKGIKINVTRKPFNPTIPSEYKYTEQSKENTKYTTQTYNIKKEMKGRKTPFIPTIPQEYTKTSYGNMDPSTTTAAYDSTTEVKYISEEITTNTTPFEYDNPITHANTITIPTIKETEVNINPVKGKQGHKNSKGERMPFKPTIPTEYLTTETEMEITHDDKTTPPTYITDLSTTKPTTKNYGTKTGSKDNKPPFIPTIPSEYDTTDHQMETTRTTETDQFTIKDVTPITDEISKEEPITTIATKTTFSLKNDEMYTPFADTEKPQIITGTKSNTNGVKGKQGHKSKHKIPYKPTIPSEFFVTEPEITTHSIYIENTTPYIISTETSANVITEQETMYSKGQDIEVTEPNKHHSIPYRPTTPSESLVTEPEVTTHNVYIENTTPYILNTETPTNVITEQGTSESRDPETEVTEPNKHYSNKPNTVKAKKGYKDTTHKIEYRPSIPSEFLVTESEVSPYNINIENTTPYIPYSETTINAITKYESTELKYPEIKVTEPNKHPSIKTNTFKGKKGHKDSTNKIPYRPTIPPEFFVTESEITTHNSYTETTTSYVPYDKQTTNVDNTKEIHEIHTEGTSPQTDITEPYDNMQQTTIQIMPGMEETTVHHIPYTDKTTEPTITEAETTESYNNKQTTVANIPGIEETTVHIQYTDITTKPTYSETETTEPYDNMQQTTIPNIPVNEETTVHHTLYTDETTVSVNPEVKTTEPYDNEQQTFVPNIPETEETTLHHISYPDKTTEPTYPELETTKSYNNKQTTVANIPEIEETTVHTHYTDRTTEPTETETTEPYKNMQQTTVPNFPEMEKTTVHHVLYTDKTEPTNTEPYDDMQQTIIPIIPEIGETTVHHFLYTDKTIKYTNPEPETTEPYNNMQTTVPNIPETDGTTVHHVLYTDKTDEPTNTEPYDDMQQTIIPSISEIGETTVHHVLYTDKTIKYTNPEPETTEPYNNMQTTVPNIPETDGTTVHHIPYTEKATATTNAELQTTEPYDDDKQRTTIPNMPEIDETTVNHIHYTEKTTVTTNAGLETTEPYKNTQTIYVSSELEPEKTTVYSNTYTDEPTTPKILEPETTEPEDYLQQTIIPFIPETATFPTYVHHSEVTGDGNTSFTEYSDVDNTQQQILPIDLLPEDYSSSEADYLDSGKDVHQHTIVHDWNDNQHEIHENPKWTILLPANIPLGGPHEYTVAHLKPTVQPFLTPIKPFQPIEFIPMENADTWPNSASIIPHLKHVKVPEFPEVVQADLKGHPTYVSNRPDIKGRGGRPDSQKLRPWYYIVRSHH